MQAANDTAERQAANGGVPAYVSSRASRKTAGRRIDSVLMLYHLRRASRRANCLWQSAHDWPCLTCSDVNHSPERVLYTLRHLEPGRATLQKSISVANAACICASPFSGRLGSSLHRSQPHRVQSILELRRHCLFLAHPMVVVCLDVFLIPCQQLSELKRQLQAQALLHLQLQGGVPRAAELLGPALLLHRPVAPQHSRPCEVKRLWKRLSSASMASSTASNLARRSGLCDNHALASRVSWCGSKSVDGYQREVSSAGHAVCCHCGCFRLPRCAKGLAEETLGSCQTFRASRRRQPRWPSPSEPRHAVWGVLCLERHSLRELSDRTWYAPPVRWWLGARPTCLMGDRLAIHPECLTIHPIIQWLIGKRCS